jgi:hypothetical protein
MKTRLAFCLISLLFSVGLCAAELGSNPGSTGAADQSGPPTPESVLATQLSEIASSSTLSHKAKAKQIASAVRLAVIAATADVKDPAQALTTALGIATVAAKAAPDYTEAISDAIYSIPSIASINGALAQLQQAVAEGVNAAKNERQEVNFASNPPRPPPSLNLGGGSAGPVVVSPSR